MDLHIQKVLQSSPSPKVLPPSFAGPLPHSCVPSFATQGRLASEELASEEKVEEKVEEMPPPSEEESEASQPLQPLGGSSEGMEIIYVVVSRRDIVRL